MMKLMNLFLIIRIKNYLRNKFKYKKKKKKKINKEEMQFLF